MAVCLAEALRVPLRERNALLLAAGYAPIYRQTGLDAPEMEAVRYAVELLTAQLEPNPVLVLDRYWNTLRMNAGAKRILELFPGCDSVTPLNGPRLVFHPKGLRLIIENWELVAAQIIRRVHREVADNPSDETDVVILVRASKREAVGQQNVKRTPVLVLPSRVIVADDFLFARA
jgi:MmyB-like transcription regulator ligand binding domain